VAIRKEESLLSRFFVITGTDRRNLYLAVSLHSKGHAVAFWNTDFEADNIPYVTHNDLVQAPCVLVLPLATPAHQVLSALQNVCEGSFVFGGNIALEGTVYAAQHGITYTNILDDETFCIKNAIPTAEGIIRAAVAETDRTISGMEIVVLGYGRVGQATCKLLKAMGARVVAATPSVKEMAWAQVYGIEAVMLEDLKKHLPAAEVIVNTIPAKVLGPEELEKVARSAVIIDIASDPGGVDFAFAEKLELKAMLLKGIPGTDAPVSAALYIEESILNTLAHKERGGYA
jgi:dipicolinate synthase subunit A